MQCYVDERSVNRKQRNLIYCYKPNIRINYFILYIYSIYNIINEYKEMDTF